MSGKNKAVVAVLAVLALAGAGYWWTHRAPKAAPFKEIPVRRGDLNLSIQATGSVLPENRLEIKPPIAGRVEQVLVEEGVKVKKGQILAWMSSTERAALLDAARAQGAEELKRWEELYRPTPIIAPINGTIILRSVESGQTFTTTEAIMVMSDRLTVKAQVDETDMAQVRLKAVAEIVLDAYPSHKIKGKVEQVAYEAQTTNNVTTYLVGVLPDETPDFMRSGMTANVNFVSDSRHGVLLVPNDMIQRTTEGSTVLVKAGEGRPPEKRLVELGLSDGSSTEVLGGLTDNDVLLLPVNPDKDKEKSGGNPFFPMGGGKGGRGGGGGRR